MVVFMIMRRLKVTAGGQVSVPAEVRRRWGTSTLALEDLGDRIVLRPAADDPIAAARGGLAGSDRAPTEQLRKSAREADAEAVQRRHRRTA
jgi:AbrB family looped-hinge helix DNA binding protein